MNEMKEKIEQFDALPLMRKIMILGLAERNKEYMKSNREVTKNFREKDRAFVVGIVGNFAVVETKHFYDAPYKAAIFKGGEWIEGPTCWPTVEHAMLDAISFFYERDSRSGFCYYASKMLGIKPGME